jgi:hypothetical protein
LLYFFFFVNIFAGRQARAQFLGLRHYYRELKRKTKSGQAAKKPVKWPHFAAMAFLDGHDSPIESVCTLDVSQLRTE